MRSSRFMTDQGVIQIRQAKNIYQKNSMKKISAEKAFHLVNIFIISLSLLLIPSVASEIQVKQCEKVFGGSGIDEGQCIRQTDDGGYIITGSTTSFGAGDRDVWLIKTDINGNKIWDKTFGGSRFDEGKSVQPTKDGGYIITGWTESFGSGASDVWLIKTDADGNETWDKTFGGWNSDGGNAVSQAYDDGYIISAWTSSYGNGGWEGWLIRTDENGTELWNKTFGGIKNDGLKAAIEDNEGKLILAGSTESFANGTSDAWLIQTDSNGTELWNKSIGGSGYDVAEALEEAIDGNYVFAGETDSYGAGGLDVWLVKMDSNGNKVWERAFGGTGPDYGWSVECTNDGGYIIASGAASPFSAGGYDGWLIKTDSNGTKIWDKPFGGTYSDWYRSVDQTRDGGYITTGGIDFDSPSNGDLWLLKVKSVETSNDPSAIVDGILSICPWGNGDQGSPGIPGPIEITGPSAVAIASGDDDTTPNRAIVGVASTYENGRIIALGHDGFFMNGALKLYDNREFGVNAVNWLEGTQDKKKILVTTGHGEPWVDNGDYDNFFAYLQALGYNVTILSGNLTPSALSSASILFISCPGPEVSDEEIGAINAFVSNGGGLFMQGLGWSWLSYEKRPLEGYPMNKIAESFGFKWIGGDISDPTDNYNGCPLFHVFYPQTVTPSLSDITVTLTADASQVFPGTNLTFTIRVANTGTGILNSTNVIDTMPAGMRYVSDDSSGYLSGQAVIWDVGSLEPGEIKSINLSARIDIKASGQWINEAKAIGISPLGTSITDSSAVPIAIIKSELPDLALSSEDITFSAPAPEVGDTIKVTASVYNAGGSGAQNVTLLFFEGDPDSTGKQIGSRIVPSIPAGSTTDIDIFWNISLNSSFVYIKVDPYNNISEFNENNNNAIKWLKKAVELDKFGYDANGNMIKGNGLNYTYNDANQLCKIIDVAKNVTIAEYYYDTHGKRVKKIEGDITTYYIEDLVEMKVKHGAETKETTSYYFANNERIARKDPEGVLYYYHNDHLGSTNVITNKTGTLSERVEYYPYGSIKEHVGKVSNHLYTGKELDNESRLYYYGSRYYDSKLMRFIQPDSVTENLYNPQNLNKYSYVLNNPLKYIDPSGNIYILGHYFNEGGLITGTLLVAGGVIAFAAAPAAVTGAAAAMVFLGVLGGLGGAAIIMGSCLVPEEKAKEWGETLTFFTGSINPAGLSAMFATIPFGKDIMLTATECANLGWDIASGRGEKLHEKIYYATNIGWDVIQMAPAEAPVKQSEAATVTGTTTTTTSTTTTSPTTASTTTTSTTTTSTTSTSTTLATSVIPTMNLDWKNKFVGGII